MTGTEFAAMSDEELLGRVQELKIMSRARPLDKQRLVRLLQQCGEVVAVTGDGTNDAPALNFANVGLSMGSGTSVAKDASDITLLDDSFASIATAVMWGRSLYRNIQRFVLFQLTINFAAILICFVGAVFGTTAAYGGADPVGEHHHGYLRRDGHGLAARPNPEVMLENPVRAMNSSLRCAHGAHAFHVRHYHGRGIAGHAVLVDDHDRRADRAPVDALLLDVRIPAILEYVQRQGFRNTPFGLFPACSGCREFFLILLAIAVGQVLIVEFGGEVFRTEPLAWREWAVIIGSTSLIAVGGEIVRAIGRKR